MTREDLADMIVYLKSQLIADERKAQADGDDRMLREVRRKRNIVGFCEFYVVHNNGPSVEAPVLAVRILIELTAIYDTEPDYDERWRPAADDEPEPGTRRPRWRRR